MPSDRKHREVHEEDLHEERGAAKEAHVDRDRPAHAEMKERLCGFVARRGEAPHAEERAENHAEEDADHGDLNGHPGAVHEERPVFNDDVGMKTKH